MNQTFKRIPVEKTLFFDIEAVRANKELDPESKEFQMYQKKLRNRDTDELPSIQETQDDYNKRAALKLGYTKIVTIGVGYVRAGEVFVKALVGSEEEILREFFTISAQFDYLSGFNILAYDLCQCTVNASKYFDYTEVFPDRFTTSGKKPWNLDKVVDLMDIIKGTSYTNMSFDEALYHFELDSSKTDIDGSQVSETWYDGDHERVIEYVKQDVFQTINLFCKMQFKAPFQDYIDRSGSVAPKKELTPLKDIYSSNYLSDKAKAELSKILSKKKLTKKDQAFVQDLLENVYIRSEFMDTDKPDVVEAKKAEISEFLKTFQK